MTEPRKIWCCDWGSSTFRLLLVDLSSARVIARDQTGQGIAQTFARWKEPENTAIEREAFYLAYIQDRMRSMEEQLGMSLPPIPLMLSGMASSSVGMRELPYVPLPFAISGKDLKVQHLRPSPPIGRDIFLVSGVKSNQTDEVMRGEETLVVGSAPTDPSGPDGWLILPGTHSKHIRVSEGRATELKTFMTGEFFHLLLNHSMLRFSVAQNNDFSQPQMQSFFKRGVLKGLQGNLLHNSFSVRTNDLFDHCSPEENYHFLSGLLIGSELHTFCKDPATLTLVCGPTLHPMYITAFQLINAAGGRLSFRYLSAEEALIRGQINLYTRLKQNT